MGGCVNGCTMVSSLKYQSLVRMWNRPGECPACEELQRNGYSTFVELHQSSHYPDLIFYLRAVISVKKTSEDESITVSYVGALYTGFVRWTETQEILRSDSVPWITRLMDRKWKALTQEARAHEETWLECDGRLS
jgi:hypothetical protein